MPFHRENYPDDWEEIRARILARADDKCEFCGAPNHTHIVRSSRNPFEWRVFPPPDAPEWGDPPVAVVLTVAHLDHDTTHNDDNLRALCQRCHLVYDATHHAQTAAATRRKRRAALQPPLFE